MKKRFLFFFLSFGFCLSGFGSQVSLDKETFQAQTLSPLQASTNKIGDRFTLLVLSPDRWKNSMIDGEITEAKISENTDSGSNLAFSFQKMALPDGSMVTIQASLISIANSKGQAGMDEDGHLIGQSSQSDEGASREEPKKSKNVFSRFGKKVAKGAKGFAQKIAGGITIAFTSESRDIRFSAGSIFTLQISTESHSNHSSSSP